MGKKPKIQGFLWRTKVWPSTKPRACLHVSAVFVVRVKCDQVDRRGILTAVTSGSYSDQKL